MDLLSKFKKKKVKLEEIESKLGKHNYQDLYQYILKQIEDGRLQPIKNSGLNGKKPALYQAYRIVTEPADTKRYEEELQYQLHPRLKIDYYIRNFKQYEQDRDPILKLSDFLSNQSHLLQHIVSANERSFQIWQREKFLKLEGGERIIKLLGLSTIDLNLYETAEPIAYYTNYKNHPQNILIIENKDTFYSMRRHLLSGKQHILGKPIGTLIYGGGKSVSKAFRDFSISVEPYLLDHDNRFYYFGDLDYEGIAIYHQLAHVMVENDYDMQPFVEGYQAMLLKAIDLPLSKTKLGQNRHIAQDFFENFTERDQQAMKEILTKDDYIPQEILTLTDF